MLQGLSVGYDCLDANVSIEIFDRRSARRDEALTQLLEKGENVATTMINLREI
ncbi:hypothetical protein KEJ37_05460 [Candidatus Bathyarchaeota archaeon]|nr:hypothetical protein [Candidatus Bathyarchaeota archaeon]